jgi:putative oxidoreductase
MHMKPELDLRYSAGTTLLRLAVGAVFAAHGAQKLFQFGPSGVAGYFASLGIPAPELNAYLVIAIELLGGIAVIAGLGTRLFGALFAAVMVVAVATVHAQHGFFLPNGYEFNLVLLAASLTLVLQGAGAWALDNLVADRKAAAPHLSPARA